MFKIGRNRAAPEFAKVQGNEQLERQMIDALPQIIWTAEPDGRTRRFNEWAKSYTGSDLNALRGDCWVQLIHPDDLAKVRGQWARERGAGRMIESEFRIRRADGQYRWHLVRQIANRTKNGTIESWMGTCTDTHHLMTDERRVVAVKGVTAQGTTERKDFENALFASEERFRVFMDNCPAVAIIKDEKGRYVYVNSTWHKQFGTEPIEWFGKTDYDFWSPETAELFRASDQECLARNITVQSEETTVTPSRGEVTWCVMKFPLQEGDRRWVGCVAWDVSDHKRDEGTVQLLHRAIEAVPHGIIISDADLPDLPIIYARGCY